MAIGKSITYYREHAGLSQLQLAEHLEIKQYTLSKYERGVNKVPADLLPKLSEFLYVSTDMLLGIRPKSIETPKNHKMSSREGKLISVFRELGPRQQKAILEHAIALKVK